MRHTLPCIETHTCGEPTRILTMFNIPGNTMAAKQDYVRQHLDHVRKTVIREPRGHRHMFGAIVTAPVEAGSACGVIWFDNQDYLNGCGHATIGLGVGMRSRDDRPRRCSCRNRHDPADGTTRRVHGGCAIRSAATDGRHQSWDCARNELQKCSSVQFSARRTTRCARDRKAQHGRSLWRQFLRDCRLPRGRHRDLRGQHVAHRRAGSKDPSSSQSANTGTASDADTLEKHRAHHVSVAGARSKRAISQYTCLRKRGCGPFTRRYRNQCSVGQPSCSR
jgi:hypothetical protein